MRMRRRKLGQEGQTTIEFALTFMLFFVFIMFYIRLSLVMAFGNLVHYATFMAARAYYAAGPGSDDSDQRARARNIIVQLLKKGPGQAGVDKFPSIANGIGGGDPGGFEAGSPGNAQFDPKNRAFSWQEGVRYTFKSRFFMTPLGSAVSSTIVLTSESWLGREPNEGECIGALSQFATQSGPPVIDNGC